MHVCLRACVSSASYDSMSHDGRVLLTLTKIRRSVICPVNCSALLNYSRPGKRLRTAIFSRSLSLSPSLPRSLLLACVWSPGREVEVGWELPASPPSACHCVSHRAAGRLSYLLGFSWACVRVHAVHNIRRHRSGRCTVTCSLTGTLTQSFSYFPHRCLKLTLTYASTPPALPKHEFN